MDEVPYVFSVGLQWFLESVSSALKHLNEIRKLWDRDNLDSDYDMDWD